MSQQPTIVTKLDVWHALRRISADDSCKEFSSEEEPIDEIKSLLATGSALSSSFLETDEAGLTVVHIAAQEPHVLKRVLDSGAPVDALDSAGRASLHSLCS
jgi:hypothetical protein